MKTGRTTRWLGCCLLCLCWQLASAQELSPSQHALASQLAAQQPWPQHRSSAATDHKLGVQTLVIERDERKGSSQYNRARVYQYDYTLQKARLLIVDLDQARSMGQWLIESSHLPLNAAEINAATELLSQDQNMMTQLRQEQRRRGKTEFNSLDQLNLKASIFEPGNSNHSCARQRCALLSLFDDTLTVFNLEPLVNLSRSSVARLQDTLRDKD